MTKVSICTVTYNHAPYIAQAIEGVLAQRRPDLELEMIIGEDCSTDNTRAIVADYARRYPDIVKPLLHAKNLGPGANSRACIAACTGEFVAVLEGDDYWTDPHKLIRQVEFMKANPDFSFCFHNALVVFEDGSGKNAHLMTNDLKPEYTLADITKDWNIATASVMYRNGLISQLPDWVFESVASDLPIFTILASQGRVGFLPQCMSVYRINSGGASRTGHAERYVLSLVQMHKNVDRYLNYRYHQNLTKKLAEDYLMLANIKLRDLDHRAARHYMLRVIWLQLSGQNKLPTINNLKLLVGTIAPGLVRRFGRGSTV